jgi:purine-nucleoside phosphorylase
MKDRALRSRATLAQAAQSVQAKCGGPPRLGLVLGSGLGPLAEKLEGARSIAYSEIPGMPGTSVPGHCGRLTLGGLGGVATACLEGRVHLYEGYEPEDVVFGVRLLARLGCETVMLTNAAGATTPKFASGSVMLIADHINLTGKNPLVAWTAPVEFTDLSDAYDAELRALARAAALETGVRLYEGVYAGLTGPSYETKAEVSYLAQIGADAVGMSTVLETIALREQGVRVIALSCITNAAAGIAGAVLDHVQVQQVAQGAAAQIEVLIRRWVQRAFGAL